MSRFLAECVRFLVCNNEPVRVGRLGTFFPRRTKPYRISHELEVHFLSEESCVEHSPNLISLVNRLGFSESEAIAVLDAEVSALKEALRKEGVASFGVLGRLVVNGSERVEWEPAIIESGEWWGFSPIGYRVFYRRRGIETARAVILLVLAVVLGGLLVYQIMRFPGGLPALFEATRDYALWLIRGTPPEETIYLSELESLLVEKIKEVQPPPRKIPPAETVGVRQPPPPPSPPAMPYSYHIVIASVPSRRQAEQMVEDLHRRGYRGAFLVKHPAKPYWRVVAASFTSMEEAFDSLNYFKKVFARDAWVLRFDTILAVK